MKLGAWLLLLCEPLVARILIALGLSVVTVAGVDGVLNGLKASFVTSFNSMPATWIQFALYLWIGKAIGIIFGAYTTKLVLSGIASGARFLGKSA